MRPDNRDGAPAPTVACGCGRVLTLADCAAGPRCPNCGREHGVPEKLASIASNRRRIARTYGAPAYMIAFGMVVATGVAAGVPIWLHSTYGWFDESAMAWLLPGSILGTYALTFVAAMVWTHRTDERPHGSVTLGSAALGSAASKREARQIALAAHAEPRNEMVIALSRSAADWTVWIPAATLLVPFGGVMAYASFAVLSPREQLSPLAFAFGWSAFLAGCALLAFYRHRRQRRLHAYRSALGAVAATLGGRRMDTFAEGMAWLNEFWAAPSRPEELFATGFYAAVSGAVRGFPVLLEVEPDGRDDWESPVDPRVVVFVAAFVHEPRLGKHVESIRDELAQQGYALAIDTVAGAKVRARLEKVRALARDPKSLAELSTVIARTVECVELAGGRPALPDPEARAYVENLIRAS